MKIRKSKSEVRALIASLKRKGYKLSEESSKNGDFYALENDISRIEITTTPNSWVQIDILPK